jgi:hypothetical protein
MHRAQAPPPASRAKLNAWMASTKGCSGRLLTSYVEVDDRIVLAMLNDPSDLEQFSRQVADGLAPN